MYIYIYRLHPSAVIVGVAVAVGGCIYVRVLICVPPNSSRLPPMHIVLLTGHTRGHVVAEDPVAAVLFDSIMEKPMQNATLKGLIEQVRPI